MSSLHFSLLSIIHSFLLHSAVGLCRSILSNNTSNDFKVVIARRIHLFPFRTE